MNKSELVAAVAEKSGLNTKQADAAMGAVFDTIQSTMAKGEEIRLVGFGTFAVVQRAAKTGRNPSTGAEVAIAARTAPKFTPGKGLKDAMNAK